MGLGLALAPLAVFAQAPGAQPPDAPGTAATPAVVPADQQPTREQLGRLFGVMRLRGQMQNLMKTVPEMVQQQIQAQTKEMASKQPGGASLTPEQQAVIDRLTSKYMQKAYTVYPIDEVIGDMTTIYQRHLSRSDVDAYIAFYQSPAGQHLLDAQPAIMNEYMPIVVQRTRQRTMILINQMNGEVRKELDDLSKSPAPAANQPAQK
jgi:hypothetical protein